MTSPRTWDLVVVGGGTAGIVAARTAAGFGADVLLVERDRTGGDCLWTGCVPSKALLAAAHLAADARAAASFGVHVEGVRVDFAAVMEHVRRSIATIEPEDSPETLRASGAHVAHGSVRFTGPAGVSVHGGAEGPMEVRFRSAVISTGSAPVVPDIPGLAAADPLTSEDVWELRERPARLLVLGAGSIGCELGQAFARLGSRVTAVDPAPSPLTREDPAASRLVAEAMRADGVDLRLGVTVDGVERGDAGWTARLSDGSRIEVDRVLVAAGREPRTAGLGLAAAGIELDAHGFVAVDNHLRTSNRNVWAAGDVTGHPPFTHVAGVHGSLAASNAVLGLARRVDTSAVPRVTYTQPELAAVGISPHLAGPGHTVRTIEHAHVDRAVTDDQRGGTSRLVLDRRGRVVGATIVGPRAGESLAELVLAVQRGLRARDLAGAMHAYPTYGDGPWKAALAEVRDQLAGRVPRAITRGLVRRRRRRSTIG